MIDVKEFQKIRPRRGTVSQWTQINPVLLLGEFAIEYPDSGMSPDAKVRFKVGDGQTTWNNLPYCLDSNVATSIIGGDVTSDSLISIKSGSTSDWEDLDPVLAEGEIVYDATKGEIKVGDGIHRFSDLRYVGQTWESNKIYDFGNYDYPETI